MKGLRWNVKIWRRPAILIIVHIMNIFALVRVDNFPLINSSCCVLILYFAQFTVTCPTQTNQTAMHKHISCITDVFYLVSFATHPIKFLLPYSIIILRIYLPCRRILLIWSCSHIITFCLPLLEKLRLMISLRHKNSWSCLKIILIMMDLANLNILHGGVI